MKKLKKPDFTAVTPTPLLNPAERKMFAAWEKYIDKHQDAFIGVGGALTCIKNQKLYREQYDSFEDYVYDRWRFTRQHAYRLIHASAVQAGLKQVSPTGDIPLPKSERAFRELANIKGSVNQLKVLQAAAENVSDPAKITAKGIKQVALAMGILKPARKPDQTAPGQPLNKVEQAVRLLRREIERDCKKEVLLGLLERIEKAITPKV